ncbi:MAG: hypothetical protein LUQ59_06285 [Methanothrix sp.]|nr:hypothetical protein [Methanothrix sp.]
MSDTNHISAAPRMNAGDTLTVNVIARAHQQANLILNNGFATHPGFNIRKSKRRN